MTQNEQYKFENLNENDNKDVENELNDEYEDYSENIGKKDQTDDQLRKRHSATSDNLHNSIKDLKVDLHIEDSNIKSHSNNNIQNDNNSNHTQNKPLNNDLHSTSKTIQDIEDNIEVISDQKLENSEEFILLITWFLILTYGFDKFDQGALPAMMKYSINDHHPQLCSQCMGFGEEYTAYINSVSKLGLVVGCLTVPYGFQLVKPKVLMSISSVLTALGFTLFSVFSYNIMTEKYGWTIDTRWWILVFSRFLVGIMQAFTQIYPQVFMSMYLPAQTKTFYVSMMAATIPVGILAGYGLTSLVFYDHWQLSILFQAACQFIFAILFLWIPDSIDLTQENMISVQKDKNVLITWDDDDHCLSYSLKYLHCYYTNIISIPEYYLNTMGMCAIYFFITTIQFQSPFYFETLQVADKTTIDIVYMFNSVFVLSIGVVLGGKLVALLGGIRQFNVVKLMLGLLCFSAIGAIVFTISLNFLVISITMGVALFFGSAWLPISMTMNLEYLSPQFKTPGHSLYILVTNLFGFFPPNLVYGYVSLYYGYRTAMISCNSVGLIGPVCMIVLMFKRCNAEDNKTEEYVIEEDEVEENDDNNIARAQGNKI